MRILALDFGEKRIGLAISDQAKKIALPYRTISGQNPVGEIKKICQKEKIATIVIGLPLNLKGEEGQQAEKVKNFAELLKKKISLPIILEDERFSSKQAEAFLKKRGVRGRKEKIDTLSAVLILKEYLEYRDE